MGIDVRGLNSVIDHHPELEFFKDGLLRQLVARTLTLTHITNRRFQALK